MEFNVVMNKEYLELLERTEKLQSVLSDKILEYSNKINHEANYLLALYIEKLGRLEKEEFDIYVKAECLRRKIQLITAKINRQEEVAVVEIETQVREEFKAYYIKLEEMNKDVAFAKEYKNGDFLSDEDSAQLKKLYKRLVKRLHPDMNPDLSDKEKQLWIQVQAAYGASDLQTLTAIEASLDSVKEELPELDSMQLLLEKCIRLTASIEKYNRDLDELKMMFPFDKVELLGDEAKIKVRKTHLLESIEKWNKRYQELMQRYEKLVEMCCGVNE